MGPGSFTGLRVGMAFALGLGAALGKPVVGLSTLDALAGASDAPDCAALIDARRGQVYARFWKAGKAQGPAEPLSIEEAQARVAELTMPALIGSGSRLVLESAPGATVVDAVGAQPEDLARLTAALDPATSPPKPLYLRAPDATPPTRRPGQPRLAVRPGEIRRSGWRRCTPRPSTRRGTPPPSPICCPGPAYSPSRARTASS